MPAEIDVRPLGWGRFLLQFVTVILAWILASIPPVLVFGETNTGILLSTFMGMAVGLLVAWAWLQADGALGAAWNLRKPDNPGAAAGLALAATVAIIAIFMTSGIVLDALGLERANVELVMQFVTESPVSLALWIVLIAWLSAGLGEELLWRGFLLDRLMRLPGIQGRIWVAVLLQAAVFALPHLYQGLGGALITGVIGILFGWMRIAARWNLWPLIIAHAAVDTIMMGLGYASVQGWIAAG